MLTPNCWLPHGRLLRCLTLSLPTPPPFSFFLSSFGLAMSEGKNESSWEEPQICSVSKTDTCEFQTHRSHPVVGREAIDLGQVEQRGEEQQGEVRRIREADAMTVIQALCTHV